jgi:drug/metabolite transporter (DMT)-like permease
MNPKRTTAFLTISLIWGSMWIVQQQLPDPSSQLTFTAITLALSAIILAIVAAVLRLPLLAKREWLASAALGITLIVLPYLLSAWASMHLSSGLSAVVAAATPLVAGFFCDTPWRARNASIAGLGGVLLVVGGTISASWNQLPWTIVLLGSTCAIAASLVFAKKRLVNCHPVYTAAVELAMAAVILGLFYLAKGKQMPSSLPWTLVLLPAAGSAAASALYFWLLKHIRVDQLTSTIWAQLLVSVAESVLLLPHVDWRVALGAAIIFGSLVALVLSKSDEPLLTVGVTKLTPVDNRASKVR